MCLSIVSLSFNDKSVHRLSKTDSLAQFVIVILLCYYLLSMLYQSVNIVGDILSVVRV